jgi:gamma-glutamyl:cysteine ligase YbdK (ATP-grasp superfamily)
VVLHNALNHLCAYLPAIAASSPICEGKFTAYTDSRLHFYPLKTTEIPSIAGDVVPGYITSFKQFRREVIDQYSQDLVNAGVVSKDLLYADHMNQRALRFRFAREAIEVRVMDEQDCIQSDVAFSCFIRASIRGLLADEVDLPSHQLLVNDYNEILKNGLRAEVSHPRGKTARQVCQYFFDLASEYAEKSEKKYLWVVRKRIENGSLSDVIRERVLAKAQKSAFREAIVSIYSDLIESLSKNQPYF